jgi:uncharacterized phage-associated protein
MLDFQFDERKGIEAVTYIAAKWPCVSIFYAAEILFFAEKFHLNRYARPIVADTFIAMPNGPVPSSLYAFIKGQMEMAGDADSLACAFSVETPYPRITAQRPPDIEVLAPSDIECLDNAIDFCRHCGFGALCKLTHREKAWATASPNGPIDYEAMIDDDNPFRETLLEEIREFAAYGSLGDKRAGGRDARAPTARTQ